MLIANVESGAVFEKVASVQFSSFEMKKNKLVSKEKMVDDYDQLE